MKAEQIIRAWKDEAYLGSLSAEERLLLPQNPAGSIEIPDEDLDSVAGGTTSSISTTITTTITATASPALSDLFSCYDCWDFSY